MVGAKVLSNVALAVLVLGLAAMPFAVNAQPAGKVPRIGVLWPGASPPPGQRMDWFREGLLASGYVEGQNVVFDLRYAERADRLRELAEELVRSNVAVIATFGDLAPTIVQKATATIPIVALTDDFVGTGLATTLGRPERNLTGVNILSPELSAKRLSLLKEMLPKLSRVAVLWDPANSSQLRSTEDAARSLTLKLQVLEVRGRDDLASAFQAAKKGRSEAVNVLASPLLASLQSWIMELAATHRLPAIYQWKEHAEAGGLASYGPSLAEMWRQTAVVVAKILRGAKPGTLPIEQPTRFELAINMKTAKALGLTVPPAVRLRADLLIE